jgi:hypothetical protein
MNRLSKLPILILLSAAPVFASYITLGNNGVVTGAPGDTVGWDFTIVNNSAYWIVITGVQASGETLPLGSGSTSSFQDYAGIMGGPDTYNFTIPPPPGLGGPIDGGEWLETFSVLNFSGLGAYSIDPGVVPPAQDMGVFLVYYSLWSSEDTSDPRNDLQDSIQLCTADVCSGSNAPTFEIDVQDTVPEPGTMFLTGGALLAVVAKLRRSRAGHGRPLQG